MEKLVASSRSKPRIVRELRHDDPSALTPFRGSGLHAQMVAYSLESVPKRSQQIAFWVRSRRFQPPPPYCR